MNYKPGTVGVATVRGVPNVRVFLDESEHICWTSAVKVKGSVCHYPDDVTDVRPLIVLDLGDSEFAAKMMIETLSIAQARISGSIVDLHRKRSDIARLQALIDQIEAQTKPPRIPEPGLWGVVEAWTPGIPTRRWVHHEEDRWVCDTGYVARWEDLNEPVLVRPGIEEES